MTTRLILSALFLAFSFGFAQEWPYYGGDSGGMKYSELKEINRSNVSRLRPAWIFHTRDVSDGSIWPTRSAFECTPLVVDGVMYLTTPFSRLIALDAETGEERWSFDPRLELSDSANLFVNRGVAYWSEGKNHRIFLGTLDGRLFSIVAETGKPDESFGTHGWIDLRKGIAEKYPDRRIGMTSPPAIFKNVVICGSLVPDGEPHGPLGDVRAFDARSGKLIWTFHTVAQPGETGGNTWAEGSSLGRGGVNAWPPLSVDTTRGIVFLPLTSPSTDFYGGDRKGPGLFGDSLVALDASTGKRIWHFQTVHHNLWDYDLPAAPVLLQVVKDGKRIDAVAQVTKTGYTFVFDRVTGAPIFPIEEVSTPQSKVPTESASRTQPRPTKPPPYARQSMSASELTDVSPNTRAYCAELMKDATLAPIFTPLGPTKTIIFPGTNGGANWGGASFDPETHTLYVNSMDVGMVYRMVQRPAGSEIPYRQQGFGSPNSRFWDSELIPCQKPPFGFLTAIDLDSGTFRWRSVLGVVDKLMDRGLPPTGAPNIGGSLVTAGGLVFIGATNDSRFRAFDKETGKELWTTKLPASAHASPMTFRGKTSGKQYLVVAAGGGNKYSTTYSDALIAFTLESSPSIAPRITYSRTSSGERTLQARAAQSKVQSDHEPFSHQRHAPLKLGCAYCHASVTTADRASFPSAKQCMLCHGEVAKDRPLILSLAAKPPDKKITPVTPVYRLPDFVFFRHSQHTAAALDCKECHGDVWQQDRMKPKLEMKMGACVECHRQAKANVSCTACHELSQ